MAVLKTPVVLAANALYPREALKQPVVLLLNAQNPTAVLFDAVLHTKALCPTAVLAPPTVFANNVS